MRNFIRIRSSKLLLKLLASYLLFLVIPIVIYFVSFYSVMIDYYEKEISNSDLNKIHVVQNSVDSTFDSIIRSALRISADKRLDMLHTITSDKPLKNADDILRVKAILDLLNDTMSIDTSVQSIYLYLKDSNLVIRSRQGIFKISDFSDKKIIEEYINSGEKRILTGSRVLTDNIQTQGGLSNADDSYDQPNNVVSLCYPLTPYTSNINGAIIINIRERDLFKYINSMSSGDEKITYVADQTGRILICDESKLNNFSISQLENIAKSLLPKENTGYFSMKIRNVNYLISYIRSDSTGLMYLGITSTSSLFVRAIFFKLSIGIITVIFLILGLVLSYFLSNQFYSPIKSMIVKLQNEKDLAISSDKNELSLLSNSINHIINEREMLKSEIEKIEVNAKQVCVLRLIEGNINESEDLFRFENHNFLCIVISIDKYVSFTTQHTYEEQYCYKKLILSTFESSINSSAQSLGAILQDDKLAVILNISDEKIDFKQNSIESICKTVQRELLDSQDISISIGIGNCYRGMEYIKASYLESLEAVKYKIVFGYKSIIHFSSICDRTNSILCYPVKREKLIINYMDTSKYDELLKEVDGFFEELKSENEISYDGIIHSVYQLVGNSTNALISSNDKITDVFGGYNNIYIQLSEKETLDDISQWFNEFYSKIIKYRSDEDRVLKKNAKLLLNFIINNYTRSDLGIDKIADETNISYPHLRRVFKDSIGVNVTDYINNLRITEAKKLLLETDLTIKDIAKKVGYNTDQSFTRCFKKNEGITPGEYKIKNKRL